MSWACYENTFQWFKVTLLFWVVPPNFQEIRVYSEDVELDSRDAKQDYKQFKESCDSLASLMSEIQNLKANGAKEGVRYMFKERNHADLFSNLCLCSKYRC